MRRSASTAFSARYSWTKANPLTRITATIAAESSGEASEEGECRAAPEQEREEVDEVGGEAPNMGRRLRHRDRVRPSARRRRASSEVSPGSDTCGSLMVSDGRHVLLPTEWSAGAPFERRWVRRFAVRRTADAAREGNGDAARGGVVPQPRLQESPAPTGAHAPHGARDPGRDHDRRRPRGDHRGPARPSSEFVTAGGADILVAQDGASDLTFGIVPTEDVERIAARPVERATRDP